MPRVSTKKPRKSAAVKAAEAAKAAEAVEAAKAIEVAEAARAAEAAPAVEAVPPAKVRKSPAAAVAAVEPAVAPEPSGSGDLRPPSTPVELAEEPKTETPRTEERHGTQRDKIVASLNIAKLQAMQMSELNHMAQGTRRGKLRHDAQARGHFPHPPEKRRTRGRPVFRGRARNPAGGLRLPPFAELQLPAVPGGHLRLAVANPPVRPCRPATSSPARSARPRKRKSSSPCSRSRAWTARTRTRPRKRRISTT
jgi:hypothetical protein